MTLLLASLLAFGSPAMAVATDPVAAPAAATTDSAPAKPKEKKVCRNDERTYSRIPKRICKTAAEWQEVDGVRASQNEPEVRRE